MVKGEYLLLKLLVLKYLDGIFFSFPTQAYVPGGIFTMILCQLIADRHD